MDGTTSLASTIATPQAGEPPRETSHALLDVAGLGKAYGDQVALADISFAAEAGEILGIIGPNGAGKTTLLEALAGLLPVDRGRVHSRGQLLPAARRRDVMFYVPDGIRPYGDQPVAHVLAFFAGVYRKPDEAVSRLIAATGLAPVLTKRVHDLSKGFGRRLLLALGLLAPHDLVLMDEPFDGFDLRQTRGVAGMLRNETAKGRALLLAIHQLIDAERVCDRFILLSAGRMRGCGTLDDLRARTGLAAGSLEDVFLALT